MRLICRLRPSPGNLPAYLPAAVRPPNTPAPSARAARAPASCVHVTTRRMHGRPIAQAEYLGYRPGGQHMNNAPGPKCDTAHIAGLGPREKPAMQGQECLVLAVQCHEGAIRQLPERRAPEPLLAGGRAPFLVENLVDVGRRRWPVGQQDGVRLQPEGLEAAGGTGSPCRCVYNATKSPPCTPGSRRSVMALDGCHSPTLSR